MSKLYRIWKGYTDGEQDQERNEIARIKAFNVSDVIDHITNKILNNEINFYIDLNFAHFYMVLDQCKNCDLKNTDPDICDDCEYTEYIEIEHNDKVAEKLTVDGENKFIDLTDQPRSMEKELIGLTLSKIKSVKKVD